jgi:uncharacterized protein (DUF2236 family)
MHSLLDTCLKEIDLQAYLSQVISGLSDDDEVKKLCYVMLTKLAHVAPTAVSQRAFPAIFHLRPLTFIHAQASTRLFPPSPRRLASS